MLEALEVVLLLEAPEGFLQQLYPLLHSSVLWLELPEANLLVPLLEPWEAMMMVVVEAMMMVVVVHASKQACFFCFLPLFQ